LPKRRAQHQLELPAGEPVQVRRWQNRPKFRRTALEQRQQPALEALSQIPHARPARNDRARSHCHTLGLAVSAAVARAWRVALPGVATNRGPETPSPPLPANPAASSERLRACVSIISSQTVDADSALVIFSFMDGVSFHTGRHRALFEVNFQPKGCAAFLIYTLYDRTTCWQGINQEHKAL
jgi:hypothetical protein